MVSKFRCQVRVRGSNAPLMFCWIDTVAFTERGNKKKPIPVGGLEKGHFPPFRLRLASQRALNTL